MRTQALSWSTLRPGRLGGAELALAGLVIAVVAMMIVPLPTPLLDVLIATNLSLAVAVLLVVLYVSDALAIATFPTILLLTTLFRLALNVSSTRLILLQADAGEVIKAFGGFVVRGNYVVGGVVFPIIAGLYYWMPRFTHRMLDEGLGRWHFWLFFLGANLAFFPMHIVGMLGMARRVYSYPAGYGWEVFNVLSTIGAVMMAVGTLIFIGNVVMTLRSGKRVGQNPWDADTLEWAPGTPVPQHGFTTIPIIHSRHPLWDQTELHAGDPKTVALVRALAPWCPPFPGFYLYVPSRAQMPAKLRALMDFLIEQRERLVQESRGQVLAAP